MKQISILWADDEIDLLKIQVLFLEEKGYSVDTATNGKDAIDLVKGHSYDIIFLDENMPGISGLETLALIKAIYPSIPVVMVTKSEEEDIMDEAIGSKISDYLIKPVSPKQLLLSIKKHVDNQRLITQKTTSAYQTEFGKLGMQINETRTFDQWVEVYQKLVYWELELAGSQDVSMDEILKMQKNEANSAFVKFIQQNYLKWLSGQEDKPLMSPSVFQKRVFPLLDKKEKVIVILVDNLRYDQWKTLQPTIREFYKIEHEELFCGILPTATQYARNAMFAGLMPSEIYKLYKEYWVADHEEGGKNNFESELLEKQLGRLGFRINFFYDKVLNTRSGKKQLDNLSHILEHPLSVIVYNFIDMLSHARTDMEVIRELANDESAYRSLTQSWFKHSYLFDFMKEIAEKAPDTKVIITTDHGTIQVNNAVKVVGDKQTTTNLRYKQGRNLSYKSKEVFEITDPAKAYLPITNLSSTYIFARNDDFFAYPNNYNHYVRYYKNTFQHGGVSMEEMLIPFIILSPKK